MPGHFFSSGKTEGWEMGAGKVSLLGINLAAMRLQVLSIVSWHCEDGAKDAADGCLPGAALIHQVR